MPHVPSPTLSAVAPADTPLSSCSASERKQQQGGRSQRQTPRPCPATARTADGRATAEDQARVQGNGVTCASSHPSASVAFPSVDLSGRRLGSEVIYEQAALTPVWPF